MNDRFDPYLEWLDIPLDQRPFHYYQLLGVQPFEEDLKLIAARADERMGKIRGYQVGPRGRWSQQVLNELAAARGCLINPETKAAYDSALRGLLAVESIRAPVASTSPPAYVVPPTPPQQEFAATPTRSDAPREPDPPPIRPTYVSIRAPIDTVSSVAAAPPSGSRHSWMLAAAGGVVAILAAVAWLLLARTPTPKIVDQKSEPSKATVDDQATDRKGKEQKGNEQKGKEQKGKDRTGKASDSHGVQVEPDKSGKLDFSAPRAELEGTGLVLEVQGTRAVVSGWRQSDAALKWRFRVPKPGIYEVLVHYSATEPMAGGIMKLSLDDAEKLCDVRESGEDKFHFEKLFIKVPRAGEHILRLGVEKKPSEDFLIFSHIEFVPQR